MSDSTIAAIEAHPAFRSWSEDEREAYMRAIRGGHADSFLSFIQHELSPYIAQQYWIDDRRVGLWGYSYGGLFALYAVFKQSGVFSHIGAGSPAVLTPDSRIFRLEAEARPHGVRPVSLHLTLHASELTGPDWGCRDFAIQFARLVDILHRGNIDGLVFKAEVLAGESHATGWTQAFLRFVRSSYAA